MAHTALVAFEVVAPLQYFAAVSVLAIGARDVDVVTLWTFSPTRFAFSTRYRADDSFWTSPAEGAHTTTMSSAYAHGVFSQGLCTMARTSKEFWIISW
jgi:hypothetical protein